MHRNLGASRIGWPQARGEVSGRSRRPATGGDVGPRRAGRFPFQGTGPDVLPRWPQARGEVSRSSSVNAIFGMLAPGARGRFPCGSIPKWSPGSWPQAGEEVSNE